MTRSIVAFSMLAVAALIVACDRDNMRQGARLKPLESHGKSALLLATDALPEGVVARTPSELDPTAQPITTRMLLVRGRALFDTFCAPCHARDGYGDGVIVQHGFPPPPSLHDPVQRDFDDVHYFRVITQGLGKMPPYATQVTPDERWAIVAYIRALQLSQHAPASAASSRITP